MKTLQEGYNLLFSESLKQQESQPSGDRKVEEKVTLLTNVRSVQESGLCVTENIWQCTSRFIRGKYLERIYLSVWRLLCTKFNLTCADHHSFCAFLISALHGEGERIHSLTLLFQNHSLLLGILL